MMDITVIAESTPGPIAINCATYTGYHKAGFAGSLVATLGIVVPSFFVIYLISIVIALSPVGEFIIRIQTGCRKIKRVIT